MSSEKWWRKNGIMHRFKEDVTCFFSLECILLAGVFPSMLAIAGSELSLASTGSSMYSNWSSHSRSLAVYGLG